MTATETERHTARGTVRVRVSAHHGVSAGTLLLPTLTPTAWGKKKPKYHHKDRNPHNGILELEETNFNATRYQSTGHQPEWNTRVSQGRVLTAKNICWEDKLKPG